MAITTINENDYIKDSRTVINDNFTELDTTKAPLNSPALTGTPTAPTPNPGDDSTKLATTAYVKAVVADYLELTGGSITGDVDITGDLSVSGTITGNLVGNADTATSATNDANGNPIAGTYLPLAGGTMTGTLNLQANPSTNDSFTDLVRFDGVTGQGLTYRKEAAHKHCLYLSMNEGGGWPSAGGQIELWGGTDADGHITLTASNGTNYKPLMLRPDGTLTWDGKNVAVVNSSSLNSAGGYIRFTNGLQICWGSNSGSSIPQTITYPAAFNGLPCIGIQSGDYAASAWATTGFSLIMATGHTKPSTVYFRYIAVGAWG